MIKLFEKYKEYDQVRKWLDKMGINNYIINDDLTVDVDGDVSISNMMLKSIPIKFGNVIGNFSCGDNELTTLEGCPEYIGGYFNCYKNKLTSLVGGPKEVHNHFNCYNNRLITLKGSPVSIGGGFSCSNNQLTSLKGCPNIIDNNFDCAGNNITSLEGCPISVKGDIFCNKNMLSTLKWVPNDIGGNIYIQDNEHLPKPILDFKHTLLLVKYQEEYGVWNSDGSFNEKRFNIFLQDYDDGILN